MHTPNDALPTHNRPASQHYGYLIDLPKHVCGLCPQPAEVALYNRYNARIGVYCRPHGAKALKNFIASEVAVERAWASEGPP